MSEISDIFIVGAGLVGAATAYQLLSKEPTLKLTLIDKERGPALHQSGRNSGVIHSGIYYVPGSEKARTCGRGRALLESFCEAHRISWRRTHKLIVATEEDENSRLETLYQKAIDNRVPCQKVSGAEIVEIEPQVKGIAALHLPEAGVVDFAAVNKELLSQVEARGGKIIWESPFHQAKARDGHLELRAGSNTFIAHKLINCAGLYSDKIASACGIKPKAQIVPFKGEYFSLVPEAADHCRGLIYPVPDPAFPFLGVHLTRNIHDQVHCGPNAVWALSKENYGSFQIKPGEMMNTMIYSGFRRFAAQHWQRGFQEMWRSFSKRAFLKSIQRLVPAIEMAHIRRDHCGIRAQALLESGQLVDDFLIQQDDKMLHVINAPSPAATASLAIGEVLAEKALG